MIGEKYCTGMFNFCFVFDKIVKGFHWRFLIAEKTNNFPLNMPNYSNTP